MPLTERIKAEISFHEKMFFSAIAVILAIIGWAVSHISESSLWLTSGAAIALFVTFGFGIWNYRRIKQLLEELEDA